MFPAGQNNIDITSITDSDRSAWNLEQTNGDSAQIWYAANRPANSGLTVSIHISGTESNKLCTVLRCPRCGFCAL